MERIDEIRQRMVAALYDELPEEELHELQARIAADPELSREWEELRGARAFLQEAASEEPAPQFVFLGPEPAAPRARTARRDRAGAGWFERWLAGLRGPATGFALAAGTLVVLVAAGLRVDRTPGGLIVHFGGSTPETPAQGPDGSFAQLPGAEGAGVPIEPGGALARPDGSAEGLAVAGQTPYLTRSEFAAYANQLAASVEQGLDDYALRGRGETVVMLREVYDQIERNQQRDREAIRAQINDMWLQLVRAGEDPGSASPAGVPAVPGGLPGGEAQPLERR